MQGFVSHSLGVVNNVVLKTCEVLPSGMIQSHRTYLHKTLPDLTLLVGASGYFTSPDIFTSNSLAFQVNSHGLRYYEDHTWVQHR